MSTQRRGRKVVNEPGDAEIIIVNTCAFIEEAKQESIACGRSDPFVWSKSIVAITLPT